jgi:hypothetical protein
MASLVLENIAAGLCVDEIVKLYPTLHAADVAAVLAYAAELASERVVVTSLKCNSSLTKSRRRRGGAVCPPAALLMPMPICPR